MPTYKYKGTLVLSNPTSNVTFSISGEPVSKSVTISGVYEDSSGFHDKGTKITINGVTSSVNYRGTTTNIPYTFSDNISSFTVKPEGTTYCSIKLISGNAHIHANTKPTTSVIIDTDMVIGNSYMVTNYLIDATITVNSDCVLQLGYYHD